MTAGDSVLHSSGVAAWTGNRPGRDLSEIRTMSPRDRGGASDDRPVTVPGLRQMKRKGERITMVTAYDATFARLFDDALLDMFLGDIKELADLTRRYGVF